MWVSGTAPVFSWVSATEMRIRIGFSIQMGAGKLAKVLFVASLLASQSAAEWRSARQA